MTEGLPPISDQHMVGRLKETIKGLPWMDIALITGAMTLAVIAILAQYGVLTHIGSLNAQTITQASAYSAGGLALLEAGKVLLPTVHAIIQKEKSVPQVSSKQIKKQSGMTELERRALLNFEVDEANSTRAIVYGKSPDTKETAYPSETTFKIGEQTVTLYGIYPTNAIEEVIVTKLQTQASTDFEKIKLALNAFEYDVALKIGDRFIVSARDAIFVSAEEINVPPRDYTQKITMEIEKSAQQQAIILGTPDTLTKISQEKAEQVVGQQLIIATQSHLLVQEAEKKEAKEICFILLNLGPEAKI